MTPDRLAEIKADVDAYREGEEGLRQIVYELLDAYDKALPLLAAAERYAAAVAVMGTAVTEREPVPKAIDVQYYAAQNNLLEVAIR